MKREHLIPVLAEAAAGALSLARQLERDAGDPVDALSADMRDWAAEARVHAGACLAAINHLNGVSPE